MSEQECGIILALDLDSGAEALGLAELLKDEVALVKVGLQAFTAFGPALIHDLRGVGVEVFLDLKLHDIPNTVGSAAVEAVRLGCSMLTLHTVGGLQMLRAARERVDAAAREFGRRPPRLLGVTILTSLDEEQLQRVGIPGSTDERVVHLAGLALEAGLDGVVSSPRELELLQREPLNRLLRVTPGVRAGEAPKHDQRRTMTPREAVQAGADYLVIGRPITQNPDPLEAARSINREIRSC